MKNVLVFLPAFYLLVQTNFASKVASKPSTDKKSGGYLIKNDSGKFWALLSKKKHDSVEVRSKTRKRNKKTVETINRSNGIFYFSLLLNGLRLPHIS